MQTFEGERRSRRLRFPRRWWARLALVAALLAALAVPAAWASDRFADVPDSNPHHDDINTIARAAITQGCNPPANTLYCPGDPVSRQQMGSFLARTLRALTPAFRGGTSNGGAVDPDASPIVCSTGDLAPSVNVRASLSGFVSLRQAGAGELGYRLVPTISQDSGATWSDFPDVAAFHSFATTNAAGAWSSAPVSPAAILGGPSDPSVRVGLRVVRESGTADASDSRCRILLTVTYRDAGPSSIG